MTKFFTTPILLLWLVLVGLGAFHGAYYAACQWNETPACVAQQTWVIDQR